MVPNEWLNDSRRKILDNWKISEETQNWVDWVKVAVFLSEKSLRNPTGDLTWYYVVKSKTKFRRISTT